MPLIPLEPGSALDQIFEITKGDPDAAEMASRMVLFDAWGDCLEADGPRVARVVAKALEIGHDRARRALVRTALQTRLQGGELDEVLKAAAHLTLLEDVVKDDDDDDYHGRDPGERDARGRFARTVGRALPYVQGGAESRMAQDMRTAVEGSTPGERAAYRRIALAGRAMTAAGVASGSPSLLAAGQLAQAGSDLGPEAERVLGPGIRRLSYRYRGTERRPDRGLQQQMVGANDVIDQVVSNKILQVTSTNATARRLDADIARTQSALENARPEYVPELQRDLAGLQRARAAQVDQTREVSVAQQALSRLDPDKDPVAASVVERLHARGDTGPEKMAMGVRADLAMAHFLTSPGGVPTPEHTRLSIAAGQLPPSRGVIIDRDGDLVTDAVGYHGDHYLPFDLANLRRLHGGQYVRTRAAGGPTTEDIYTGLLTGARQVSVVSNSGVFTLEFDPDLRGGRRYSDKAHAMVTRYGKLLEAVRGAEDSGLYAQDIPSDQKNRLLAEAMEQTGYDRTLAQTVYRDNLKRERMKASLASDETVMEAEVETRLDAAVEDASSRNRRLSTQSMGRLREDITREVLAEHRDNRVRPFRLDGEGYAAALNSLAEEFPQFIRSVEYRTTQQFESDMRVSPRESLRRGRGGRDKGYVAPGELTAVGDVAESLTPAPRSQQGGRPPGGTRGQAPGGTENRTAGAAAGPAPRVPAGAAPGAAPAAAAGAAPTQNAGPQGPAPTLVKGARPKPGTKDLAEEIVAARTAIKYQATAAMKDAKTALETIGDADANLVGGDTSEAEALQLAGRGMSQEYLHWLIQVQGGGSPSRAVEFLMENNERSAQHRQAVGTALDKLVTETESFDNPIISADKLAQDAETVANLDAVINPFTDPAGDDWVLQAPDLDAPKPLRLPEVTTLGADMENYDAAEKAIEADRSQGGSGKLGDRIQEFESKSDEEIAGVIRKEIDTLNMLMTWGSSGVKPPGVDNSLQQEARYLATQPLDAAPRYRTLRSAQRAWSYLKAKRVALGINDTNAITGGGGAAPLPQPPRQGATSKRLQSARVVRVHPPGSALAQAFREFRKQAGI